ncbi:MAG: hypothetical protein ABFS32_01825 [Bacteroidota bacterium]
MRYLYLILTLLILTSVSGLAQKVKYKNLFVLLNAENYQDADSYLRLFLVQDPDHSNAHYHMGKMLHTYMLEEDLLTRYNRILELADSAVFYYEKSLEYLTERDVKRHDDDYYAEFQRRDMRTGKFGVKFSDVQLEFQNKIKEVDNYKAEVIRMNHFKSAAKNYYDSCQAVYRNFTRNSETINLLFFTAGADELNALRSLRTIYDSTMYNLNTYHTIMKGMGKNTVEQELIVNSIENYPEDGHTGTDFNEKLIEFWNYKEWANTNHDVIGRQIFPLKKRMVAYDEKLMSLHNKVVNDSLDGRSEVFQLATQNVGRDLKDYENNSLPAALYNFRIAEINYHSMVNVWYKEVNDTLNVGTKLNFLDDLTKQLSSISRLVLKLEEANTDYSKRVYRDFIEERCKGKGIDLFVREQMEFVHNDSTDLKQWLTDAHEQDKYVIWKRDSISLMSGVQTLNGDSSRYSTFKTDTLSVREIGFYSWLQVNKSFYMAYGVSPSSRQLDTLYTIEMNDSIDKQLLLANQFLSDSIGIGLRIWVVNSTYALDSGHLVTVFTTDLSMGMDWRANIKLPQTPQSTKPDFDSSTVAILNEDEEVMVVLDSGGKVVEQASLNGDN